MKRRSGFVAAFLCAALLLTMTSCKNENPEEKLQKALEQYQQACQNASEANNLTLDVEFECSRSIGDEVYTEKMTGTMTWRDKGTSDVAVAVAQQVAFGPYQTQYAEIFYNGAAYCQTGGSTFRTDMKVQEFLDRQIPVVLLDAALYESVTATTSSGSTIVTFAEPKKLENWATDYEKAVMDTAQGAATIDKEGNLLSATYTAQYTCGQTVYLLRVATKVKAESVPILEENLAGIPAKCPVLTYFDAPRKILQVVGDVYTAKAMSAEYVETVSSAAYARSRTQTSSFDMFGTGSDFMARSRHEVSNTDYTDTTTTNSEEVIFRDGGCASSLNGAEPTPREGITEETMRTFCEDAVLAALVTPNHLGDARLTQTQEEWRIEFDGNDAFADNLCGSIYSIFNVDLDYYAESFTTPTAGGYLSIDRSTGLPTALGIELERVHKVGDITYPLTYQLDQTMQLSSTAAYENIVGETTSP